MPFEQPTDHYDQRIIQIDEQICSLIKQRKEISDSNPGFPPLEVLLKWAEKYELHEDLLCSIFGELVNDEYFRPQVEPIDFQKYIPVLKSVEKEQTFYAIPFIRQYANASVVLFNIDYESEYDSRTESLEHHWFWELSLGDEYDCRVTGGGGTEGHLCYTFVVSPPLPNLISELELNFIEYQTPFKRKPTGLKIKIDL